MNKTNYIYILSLILCGGLFPSITKAQVTVGKAIEAEKYAVLQIEYDDAKFTKGGGVLLPRLDLAQRTSLMSKIQGDNDALGLTIFNTTSDRVEYWDGNDWNPILGGTTPSFDAGNGLNRSEGLLSNYDVIKLGGTLLHDTDVNLNGKSMTFNLKKDASLKAGSITIKNDSVGIGTNNPRARFHINRSAPDNGLRIIDGSEGLNKVLTALDNNGFATWKDIPNVISVAKGITKTSGSIGYSGTTVGYTEITTSRVTCTAGRWLIIGRYMSRYSTNDTNYYSWIQLRTSGGSVLSVAGTKTEPGGHRYAIPVIVYYADFATSTTLGLWGASPQSTGNNPEIYTFGGTPFLTAIKLANP